MEGTSKASLPGLMPQTAYLDPSPPFNDPLVVADLLSNPTRGESSYSIIYVNCSQVFLTADSYLCPVYPNLLERRKAAVPFISSKTLGNPAVLPQITLGFDPRLCPSTALRILRPWVSPRFALFGIQLSFCFAPILYTFSLEPQNQPVLCIILCSKLLSL